MFSTPLVAPIILSASRAQSRSWVGQPVKADKHYDDRSPPRLLTNDPGDTPDAIGCGKRRTTQLKVS